MRLKLRPYLLSALLLLVSALLPFAVEVANAQNNASSGADALSLFQSLTPEQQDAILRQLGGGAAGLTQGNGSTGGTERPGDARRTQQENQNEQRPRPSDEEEEEQREPAIPVLKSRDWVIIEVDFQLPPRPLSQSLQALALSQAVSGPQGMQALQALQSGAGGANGALPLAGLAQAQAGQQPTARPNPPGGDNQDQQQQQPPPLTDQEKKSLTEMMEQIRLHNPYQLSKDGVLSLPGFPGIALLGLTEDQASMRLQAEPAFRRVQVRLTRLPLKKTGAEGLKPFGYDLFDEAPSTFAPVTNVPVPADYVVGAGDELEIQLYGTQNRTFRLVVGRDGRISLPELGPVSVGGQLFSDVKALIEGRVAKQMIGVQASVSMGDTRAIRVFVVGEAKHSGTYTVSGLATITSALFAAGGVKSVGSLRNIQLKRRGTLVRTLDLYDLLIRGDTTDDSKLLPGDVIFVPPVGETVGVDGEVHRPAIYEIKNESSVADLVALAGGLTPEANTTASLTRIDESQHRVVIRVNLAGQASRGQALRNGDMLHVDALRPTLDSGVVLQGHLYTPGVVAFREGMRLSDVIHSVDDLQPNADIHYLLIRRELPPDRRIAVLSADLAAALRAPGSAADVPLLARDRITVFDLSSSRDRIIRPLMDDLRTQSTMSQPTEVVDVDGQVKVPGEYPLEPGMTVSDLVRAGGGLADAAYGSQAELVRYDFGGQGERQTRLININLQAALRGDPSANVKLEAFDRLSIKQVPGWDSQETVTLAGEVRFPGIYAIRRGETLRSVIDRAGGLTDYAFPEGTVFTREELKKREQEQIDLLANRMQRDLAVLALQGAAANQAGAPAALSVGQTLLSQLRSAKAVGRLVIDLPQAMRSPPGSAADVILRDGDELTVPRFRQEVTVIGEVQNATSHLFRAGLSRDDYVRLSGGTTRQADRGRIYIVRANGSVLANEGSRWFQVGSKESIRPGDTIVVPLDTERMPALPFWQAVTQIIYNVAIAAAAVHSF